MLFFLTCVTVMSQNAESLHLPFLQSGVSDVTSLSDAIGELTYFRCALFKEEKKKRKGGHVLPVRRMSLLRQ